MRQESIVEAMMTPDSERHAAAGRASWPEVILQAAGDGFVVPHLWIQVHIHRCLWCYQMHHIALKSQQQTKSWKINHFPEFSIKKYENFSPGRSVGHLVPGCRQKKLNSTYNNLDYFHFVPFYFGEKTGFCPLHPSLNYLVINMVIYPLPS